MSGQYDIYQGEPKICHTETEWQQLIEVSEYERLFGLGTEKIFTVITCLTQGNTICLAIAY